MNLYFSFICVFVKDDAQEEFGWKLVHGDVFRPPKKGMLLSIMLGCGSQIFIMVFFTLGKLAILSVACVQTSPISFVARGKGTSA